MTETYSTIGPVCPYCEHVHATDAAPIYNEKPTDFQCERCSKESHMEVYHPTSWACQEIEQEARR